MRGGLTTRGPMGSMQGVPYQSSVDVGRGYPQRKNVLTSRGQGNNFKTQKIEG